MKTIITLVLLTALFSFSSCSGDKIEKQPSTQSTPANIEAKTPTPNTPNAQDLQPDLHLSGTQNTHISGASVTNHVSGR